MPEQCQRCKNQYETIYRVPNDVWANIAPNPEELGPYEEHQFGGLLCMGCADATARERGVTLYWEATEGDWMGQVNGDWRVGLTVKPKLRSDPLFYERGVVLNVLPSGTGGLYDDSGILKISMESGAVILRRAEDWVTA